MAEKVLMKGNEALAEVCTSRWQPFLQRISYYSADRNLRVLINKNG